MDTPKEDRFDYTESGNLDDVVINDVSMFRLEYMDSGHVWIRCYREGKGKDVVINLQSSTPIKAEHEVEDD